MIQELELKVQKIEEEGDLYDEEEDDDVSDLLSEDSQSEVDLMSEQIQAELKDKVSLTPKDIRRLSEFSTHKNVSSLDKKESEDTEQKEDPQLEVSVGGAQISSYNQIKKSLTRSKLSSQMTGLKGPVTMKAKVVLMQRLLKIREKTSNNQQVEI